MASRARNWQKKQQAAGNCTICGKPRGKFATRCHICQEKRNAMHRAARKGIKHRTYAAKALRIIVRRPATNLSLARFLWGTPRAAMAASNVAAKLVREGHARIVMFRGQKYYCHYLLAPIIESACEILSDATRQEAMRAVRAAEILLSA